MGGGQRVIGIMQTQSTMESWSFRVAWCSVPISYHQKRARFSFPVQLIQQEFHSQKWRRRKKKNSFHNYKLHSYWPEGRSTKDWKKKKKSNKITHLHIASFPHNSMQKMPPSEKGNLQSSTSQEHLSKSGKDCVEMKNSEHWLKFNLNSLILKEEKSGCFAGSRGKWTKKGTFLNSGVHLHLHSTSKPSRTSPLYTLLHSHHHCTSKNRKKKNVCESFRSWTQRIYIDIAQLLNVFALQSFM